MLNRYARLLSPDANTDSTSSTESDANAQSSSTAQQDDNQNQQQGAETTETADDGTEAQATSTEADGQQQADDQQNGQQQDASETEDANVVLDKPEDAQLPFHKHERFQELIKERNLARQEHETVKPLAEQARVLNEFLQTNNIPASDFQSALEYLRLLRIDPQSAMRMLKPTYDQLAQFSGDVVSPDLQEEVAAARLTPERAKELSQLRGQQQFSQRQQQWNQQGVQQQTAQAINGTIQSWASLKQTSDPDFRPKVAGKPDGLWELTDRYIRSAPPFKNAQEAMQGSEQAYKDAKALIASLRQPAPNVRRGLTSKQSSTNSSAVLKTPEDVMNAIAHGVKPHQMRYA